MHKCTTISLPTQNPGDLLPKFRSLLITLGKMERNDKDAPDSAPFQVLPSPLIACRASVTRGESENRISAAAQWINLTFCPARAVSIQCSTDFDHTFLQSFRQNSVQYTQYSAKRWILSWVIPRPGSFWLGGKFTQPSFHLLDKYCRLDSPTMSSMSYFTFHPGQFLFNVRWILMLQSIWQEFSAVHTVLS